MATQTFVYKGTKIPKGLLYEIRDVVVAPSVTTIPVEAFAGCEYLQTIKLHPNISSIGKRAFKRCASLEQINLPENLRVIEDSAFGGCILLRTVVMSNNVTRIGKWAFRCCYALASISLSTKLQHIGEGALGDCRALKAIFIPPSVKEIEVHAFANCARLIILSIPKDTKVGNEIVRGCHKLLEPTKFDSIYKANSRTEDEVNHWLKHGFKPLHQLCYQPNVIVKTFQKCIEGQQRNKETSNCLMAKNEHGMTAFHILLSNPNAPSDVIKTYLKLSPGIAIVPDNRGWYPIHFASMHYQSANDQVIDKLASAHIETGEPTAILTTQDTNDTPSEIAMRFNSSEEVQLRLYSFHTMTKNQCAEEKEAKQLEHIQEKYVDYMMQKFRGFKPESSLQLTKVESEGFVEHINCLNERLLKKWLEFFRDNNRCTVDLIKYIYKLQDRHGRALFDVASEEIRKAATERVAFTGRYWILDTNPVHVSNTSIVVKAQDSKAEEDYRSIFKKFAGRFNELDRNDFRNAVAEFLQRDIEVKVIDSYFERYNMSGDDFIQENEFIVFCKEFLDRGQNRVIKFMRHEDHFEKEKSYRAHLKKKGVNCVINVFESYDNNGPEEKLAKYKENIADISINSVEDMSRYIYTLVMPQGDKDLDSIFRTEKPNTGMIRGIAQDIAEGMYSLHSQKVCHGDISPHNCLRVQGRFILIDLDSSASIKTKNIKNSTRKSKYYSGLKFSSGALPPEMIQRLSDDDLDKYLEYFEQEKNDPGFWEKCQPKIGDNDDNDEPEIYVVKTFATEDQNTSNGKTQMLVRGDPNDLPYDLVQASEAYDLWSFGVLLYMLCTGESLFDVNRNDDLKTVEAFRSLYYWSDEKRNDKLYNVDDVLARDLLSKLLSRNPKKRGSISRALEHPFFTCKPGDSNYDEVVTKIQEIVAHEMRLVKEELVAEVNTSSSLLMKAMFEATEVRTPTCFVIRTEKLPSSSPKPLQTTPKEASIKMNEALSWLSWMNGDGDVADSLDDTCGVFIERTVIMAKKKVCYIYLVDEYSGKPVTGPGYPIKIKATPEELKKYVPIMMVGWQSITLLNSGLALANMFLPDVPKIPDEVLSDSKSFLDELKGDGTLVKKAVSSMYKRQNGKGSKVYDHKPVRGLALREFEQLLLKHDKKQKFCGLMRVHDKEGNAIWVTEESSRKRVGTGIDQQEDQMQMDQQKHQIPPIQEITLTPPRSSICEKKTGSWSGMSTIREGDEETWLPDLRTSVHQQSVNQAVKTDTLLRQSIHQQSMINALEPDINDENSGGKELTKEVRRMRYDMKNAMQEIVSLQQQFNELKYSENEQNTDSNFCEILCGDQKSYSSQTSSIRPSRVKEMKSGSSTIKKQNSSNPVITLQDYKKGQQYYENAKNYISSGFELMPEGGDGNIVVMERRMLANTKSDARDDLHVGFNNNNINNSRVKQKRTKKRSRSRRRE